MEVEYIDHMGSDERVVDAARVSFDKEATNYTEEQNRALIHYLAKHGHWTPFSAPQITLRLTVPIFVARQDFKHQIGFTRNEVSRRYVDDDPEFFVPDEWRARPEGSVKQGSGEKTITRNKYGGSIDETYRNLLTRCEEFYNTLLESGVAPEQARMSLPQAMYTSYYTTGSLAAWARAYNLRVDAHAQKEIQDLYKQVGGIIEPLFPVSWAALTTGGGK